MIVPADFHSINSAPAAAGLIRERKQETLPNGTHK